MGVADLPLVVGVAPNGAYKGVGEHRELPVTAGELARVAGEVLAAGAAMFHLHVRDGAGGHTLDAGAYREAVGAIRAEVGEGLFLQATSEAGGIYGVEEQRRAIGEICGVGGAEGVGADGVSIALRELFREEGEGDVGRGADLLREVGERGVAVQYILYGAGDVGRYGELVREGVVPRGGHAVLLVVGKKFGEEGGADVVGELRGMVGELGGMGEDVPNWMVCAFGREEFACLREGVRLGGHVRVGFENSLRLRDGRVARDNAELVRQVVGVGRGGRVVGGRGVAERVLRGL